METSTEKRKIYLSSAKILTDFFKGQGRYSVATGDGYYNLTIQQLNISDTANYSCIEYMKLPNGDENSSESIVHLKVEGI